MFETPFVIGDVGSNWRRFSDQEKNKSCALDHIRAGAGCGLNAIKFQMFNSMELYNEPGDDTYALPREWIPELAAECAKHGVEFMCTAFSADGVRFVDPYVKAHKIASAEMMHSGIINAIDATGKPYIVSTGGATDDEILKCLEFGNERAAYLECVAAYPADPQDYDLGWLPEAQTFGISTGVSDHTLGTEVALVALGLGATIFEKHFAMDRHSHDDFPRCPDDGHSLTELSMTEYCRAIRTGFSALGDGIKRPRESEADFVKYARRAPGENTFRRKAP